MNNKTPKSSRNLSPAQLEALWANRAQKQTAIQTRGIFHTRRFQVKST